MTSCLKLAHQGDDKSVHENNDWNRSLLTKSKDVMPFLWTFAGIRCPQSSTCSWPQTFVDIKEFCPFSKWLFKTPAYHLLGLLVFWIKFLSLPQLLVTRLTVCPPTSSKNFYLVTLKPSFWVPLVFWGSLPLPVSNVLFLLTSWNRNLNSYGGIKSCGFSLYSPKKKRILTIKHRL